jgi:DNA invertase Pin-like site-specific DNA recombinase
MIRPQQGMAAMYLRLSRDDGSDVESNSIGNQRSILQRYAQENRFPSVQEYIDDGISGTTFERPGFKRMIADIEEGRITIVLCKDLSRLGRNNAMVAFYTEIFFIEKRVRFIAVNDQIDTHMGDNEIMPFKSVINEFYARDISKKVKSAFKAQAQRGNYTGTVPPYGYRKNPENKYHLIPNPDTAPVVKRIYDMVASGIGTWKIANALAADGILIPSAYNTQVLGVKRMQYRGMETDWRDQTVAQIIRNQVYLGHMVSQKSTTLSFKNQTKVRLPENEHVYILNTHEPLVDQDTFDIAQKVFSIKKRGNRYDFDNIFVGLLKCSDCGSNLALAFPSNDTKHFSYMCNQYRQKYKQCTTHHIRYNDLYQLVLEGIQDKQQFVKAHEEELALYAQRLADQGADIELKQARFVLDRSQKRHGELDILIQTLFEQVALGTIPQERYKTMSAVYEDEQKAVSVKIAELESQITETRGNTQNIFRFFDLVRKHSEITVLTAEILYALIDSVVVYQAEGIRKGRTQKVVINYRFLGDNWFSF